MSGTGQRAVAVDDREAHAWTLFPDATNLANPVCARSRDGIQSQTSERTALTQDAGYGRAAFGSVPEGAGQLVGDFQAEVIEECCELVVEFSAHLGDLRGAEAGELLAGRSKVTRVPPPGVCQIMVCSGA